MKETKDLGVRFLLALVAVASVLQALIVNRDRVNLESRVLSLTRECKQAKQAASTACADARYAVRAVEAAQVPVTVVVDPLNGPIGHPVPGNVFK